jgi:TIGR03009 family protein
MVRVGLTVVALGWLSHSLVAQGVPAAPPSTAGAPGQRPLVAAPVAAPVAAQQWSPQLTAHIDAWEAKNKTINSFYTDAECVRTNTIKQKDQVYDAVIMCMKPNLARMGLTNRANKADYMAWICDGTVVCEYDSLGMKMVQHSIPPGGKGGVGDNLLLEFMSGLMTANDIKQRFAVSLEKEDVNYVYLTILPQLQKDRLEFDKMTLVLYGPRIARPGWEYLPAVVLMSKNDGQETEKWTFKEPKINNPGIKKEQFVPTAPPKNWKSETRTANVGPKVARP